MAVRLIVAVKVRVGDGLMLGVDVADGAVVGRRVEVAGLVAVVEGLTDGIRVAVAVLEDAAVEWLVDVAEGREVVGLGVLVGVSVGCSAAAVRSESRVARASKVSTALGVLVRVAVGDVIGLGDGDSGESVGSVVGSSVACATTA